MKRAKKRKVLMKDGRYLIYFSWRKR